MLELRKGRLMARLASTAQDVAAALGLRNRVFRASLGDTRGDEDPFDPKCVHVLVEEVKSARLVCCCRLLPLAGGAEIEHSYCAQFYDLTALSAYKGKMVEMGRFCIDPEASGDPDILRVVWAAVTQFVDANGVEMLFGCSSFAGTKTARYLDAFAMLKERHLAPQGWLPAPKASDVYPFSQLARRHWEEKAALRQMPPLLRTYLLMGGWVSDHAVIDHDLNTLHVFTGLEIGAIPATRARLLRGLAGSALI